MAIGNQKIHFSAHGIESRARCEKPLVAYESTPHIAMHNGLFSASFFHRAEKRRRSIRMRFILRSAILVYHSMLFCIGKRSWNSEGTLSPLSGSHKNGRKPRRYFDRHGSLLVSVFASAPQRSEGKPDVSVAPNLSLLARASRLLFSCFFDLRNCFPIPPHKHY